MSYAVVWEPDAQQDLDRLPPLLASVILDEIDRLAQRPTELSLPPSFPHPLFPKYQFWGFNGKHRYHVTVLFQYSQDERSIHILYIGAMRY